LIFLIETFTSHLYIPVEASADSFWYGKYTSATAIVTDYCASHFREQSCHHWREIILLCRDVSLQQPLQEAICSSTSLAQVRKSLNLRPNCLHSHSWANLTI